MSGPATVHRTLADDLVWAESPRRRDGRTWVSDTQGNRLVVVDDEGALVAHDLDTAINGTGFLPGGDLVAARMHAARLDRFDGTTFTVHCALSGPVDGRLGDLLVLDDGTVIVDEVHTPDVPGRLIGVDPSGHARVVAEDLVFPNGLAVVDDGHTLVVAETFAARLTAFTLGADGSLYDRRPWADLAALAGPEYRPDGICAAPDGTAWVATTTGCAFLRIAGGEVVERIDVDGFAIACCLDDDGGLYGTTATSIDPAQPVMEAAHQQRTRARLLDLRDGSHRTSRS